MIITLCGSARFESYFKFWNEMLSLAGHVVFTLSVYPSDKRGKDWYTEDQKLILDGVHKSKIAASDAIFVLNAYGYIGESTLSEISYADIVEKQAYFLEGWGIEKSVNHLHPDDVQQAARGYEIPKAYISPIDTIEHWHAWSLFKSVPVWRSEVMDLYLQFRRSDMGSHSEN